MSVDFNTRICIKRIEQVRRFLCDYGYGKMYGSSYIARELVVDSDIVKVILNYLVRLGYVKYIRINKRIYYFGKVYIGKDYEKKFKEVKYGKINEEMVESSFEESDLIGSELINIEEENGKATTTQTN